MSSSIGHPAPDRWIPTGSTLQHHRLTVGQQVGWRYAVWTVLEVRPTPEHDLDEATAAKLAGLTSEHRQRQWPYRVVLAHHTGPLDPVVASRTQTLHDGAITVHLGVSAAAHTWRVMDEHWPICHCHHHPHPCGQAEAARYAALEADRLNLLLDAHTPGRCFACSETIGPRARTVTFPGQSPWIPGAPAPTFHTGRVSCWQAAASYERKHHLPRYPDDRYVTCGGMLFIHRRGRRQECTAGHSCTGQHGPVGNKVPASAVQCTTRVAIFAQPGGYPRPLTCCREAGCLGKDSSAGAPDPMTAGDVLAAANTSTTYRL